MAGSWRLKLEDSNLDEVMARCESVCGPGECNDLEDWQFENQDTCDRIGFEFHFR